MNPQLSFRLNAFMVVAMILGISNYPTISGAQEKKIDIIGKTMGPIVYRVLVVKESTTPSEESLRVDIQETLDHVNGLMSTYIADSDLTKFNKSRSTDWIEVHADTAKVMSRALEISKASDGAFDVTVGPAVNLWNFGPDKGEFSLPGPEQIESVKKRVGYEYLSVRKMPPAIKKSVPEIEIDFSAIAKGYAVDAVADRLRALECKRFLVEVGGEVIGEGLNHDAALWRVGVEKAVEYAREIEAVSTLNNAAMATSGDYRNFEMFEGKRYSHAIDPRTCRPTETRLATACIVAKDCMTADAVATAVMVMGPERGNELCKRLGIESFLVERSIPTPNDQRKFKRHVSDAFPLANSQKPKAKAKGKAERGIVPVFLAALIVFGLAILGMSAGAIFANKPVQGSCGGLANMATDGGDTECGICHDPVTECAEADNAG